MLPALRFCRAARFIRDKPFAACRYTPFASAALCAIKSQFRSAIPRLRVDMPHALPKMARACRRAASIRSRLDVYAPIRDAARYAPNVIESGHFRFKQQKLRVAVRKRAYAAGKRVQTAACAILRGSGALFQARRCRARHYLLPFIVAQRLLTTLLTPFSR